MATTHPLFDYKNFHFDVPKQIIISYAIRDNKGKVSRKQVRTCRLVNSDWLRITTQVLRQAKEPLFYLKLDQDHCFKGSGYFDKKGNKLLELDQATPFALKGTIIKTFFRSGNSIKIIGQHLSRFRDNLLSLDIAINPKTSNLLFPGDLKLSLLQHLSVEFTTNTSKPASLSLQTIVDSCPELKTLGFFSGRRVFDNVVVVLPKDFTHVTLPETLTAIDFSSKLENEHLEIMTRSSLPKLKKFRLLIHRTPFEDGLIYRVLYNVRSSLEYLLFKGEDHDGSPEPPTYFRFPVMEKLKLLNLETQHLELKPGVESLETYLPNLIEMRLKLQTQAMLRKWTRSNSQLTYLTQLNVTMTDDNFPECKPEYYVNLNETVTREIAYTFPNVRELIIDFRHEDYRALNVVWQEMQQVEMLTLFVPKPKGFACQDQWTSILLGVPLKVAASLRTKRRITVELNNSSVKEMKNLNALIIVESYNQKKKKKKCSNIFPLLSNSVFELAFLKMPQLKMIWVEEKFWVSQKMTQEWESSSGRKIYVLNDTVEMG